MICPKCKNEIHDTAKFCSYCGSAIERSTGSKPSTIQLICKNCHGVMTVEEGKNIMYCPYCGAAEMVIDSDEVAKEKIRSKTYKDVELNKQKIEKEVEIERLRHEKEMAERELQRENIRDFKKSKLRKWVILFAIVCGAIAFFRFRNGDYLGAFIPGVQMVLFLISWLLGTGTIRRKSHGLHRVFALLGFLLIIPFFSWDLKTVPKYTWPTSGLATMLPKPESKYGEIHTDDDDDFWIDVTKYSQDQYRKYIEKCKEAGFTIDQETSSTGYDAFNSDGAKLSIDYYNYNDKMRIMVDAPQKMGTFKWPDSDLGKILPVPDSDYGEISWENSSGFFIIVGNTTVEQTQEYGLRCRDAGFDVDYSKGDTYYQADNKDGYHVSVFYSGFNTMHIRLDAPDNETTEDISDKAVSESNDQEAVATETVTSTGAAADSQAETVENKVETSRGNISQDFKEFVDSYEEFYNEYADFLESYDASDFSMLGKYASVMEKLAEFDAKADAYHEDDVTPEEWKYFVDAQARIEKRLLGIASDAGEKNVETEKQAQDITKSESEMIEEETVKEKENQQDEIITVDNNAEFARIMTRYDYWSDEAVQFLKNNEGHTIAFPGFCLESFSKTGENLITVSFCVGDHIDGVDVYGPCFVVRDTTYDTVIGNADNPPSSLQMYDHYYVTAVIDHYEDDMGLCAVTPVSVDKRVPSDYMGADIIKSVQEALNNAGYDCGTPDGIAGANTKSMISKYRDDHKLLPGEYIAWDLVTSLHV